MRRAADLAHEDGGRKAADAVRDKLGFLPAYVKFPDVENCGWLNTALVDIWPYLDEGISAVVKTSLGELLRDSSPAGIGIDLTEFTLGPLPPTITGAKSYHTPTPDITLELNLQWAGDPRVVLGVKLRHIPGVTLPVRLSEVHVFATVRVVLAPLTETLPCFQAIDVCFTDRPEIDYELCVLGGELTALPGIAKMLDRIIKQQLADFLVWPRMLHVPVMDVPEGQCTRKASTFGRLTVYVDCAAGLRSKPGVSLNPYARVTLNGNKNTRKASEDSVGANPAWNFRTEFFVRDLHRARIRVEVFTRILLDTYKAMDLISGGTLVRRPKIPLGTVEVDIGNVLIGVGGLQEAVTGGWYDLESSRGVTTTLHNSLKVLTAPQRLLFGRSSGALGRIKLRFAFENAPDGAQRMDMMDGTLEVRVRRAFNLVCPEDVYTQIKLDDEDVGVTSIREDTLNPVWEQNFSVKIRREDLLGSENHTLSLKVMGKKKFGRDSFLGVSEVDVKQMVRRCMQRGETVYDELLLGKTKSGTILVTFFFQRAQEGVSVTDEEQQQFVINQKVARKTIRRVNSHTQENLLHMLENDFRAGAAAVLNLPRSAVSATIGVASSVKRKSKMIGCISKRVLKKLCCCKCCKKTSRRAPADDIPPPRPLAAAPAEE